MGGGVLLPALLHSVTCPGRRHAQFRACDIMEFALLSNGWDRILDEWAGLSLCAAVYAVRGRGEFFEKQKELLASRPALQPVQAGVPDPFEISGADLDNSAQSWQGPGGGLGAEAFEFLYGECFAFSNVPSIALFDPARDAPLDALCELAPARAATK